MRSVKILPLSLLAIGLTLPAAFAQTQTAQATSPDSTATTQKPLQQSNEGFWGHMNPFARKKWVKRQTDPIREREDELDYVTRKNANDIRDTDERAQAGIRRVSAEANAANTNALNAGNTARSAQNTADQAAMQTGDLRNTVSNLDNYQRGTPTDIRFAAGSSILGTKARRDLDAFADQLGSEKGYVVEVTGYTSTRGTAGATQSEKMADAVERYLVAKHNIPVYRIAKLGYGSSRPEDSDVPRGSVVQVTLLHNSLAALNQTSPGSGSAIGTTQTSNSTPSPRTSASQPYSQRNSNQVSQEQ